MPEVVQEQCHPSQPGHTGMGPAAIPGASPGHGKGAGCTHSTVTREMCTTKGFICSRGQPLSAADVCTAQPNRARRQTDRSAALTQHSAHSGPHDSRRRDLAVQVFYHVPSRKLFSSREITKGFP